MSEDAAVDTPETDSGSQDLPAPEAKDSWWSFESKDAAAEYVNGVVEKRLSRERKKFDPIVAEHATLKAEVERLKPLEDATKTDAQRWEAEKQSFTQELESLRTFKSQADRTNLVREIADDKGLPAKFVARVQGSTPDEITADIDDLLNVLSEDGKPTKKPATRKPKESEDTDPPSKGYSGGGSDDGPDVSADAIIKRMREKNGGRGRHPFSLR